jgi:hypothetical protein
MAIDWHDSLSFNSWDKEYALHRGALLHLLMHGHAVLADGKVETRRSDTVRPSSW